MTATLDPFILEHAPGPLAELDPAIPRVRDGVAEFLNAMAQLDDSSLLLQWFWDGNDINVRYAFYRALEVLSAAESAARLALAGAPTTEAREAAAAADAARWDAHGLLLSLNDADLDADPGNAEWTVRQTLAHMISGQRGYAWGSAYWLAIRDQPPVEGAQRLPDEIFKDLPEEDQEALGTLAEVQQELAGIVDATSSRYATLTDDDMAVRSGWYGFPVTVGFRQWRWSSHIREHTIQLEKTLDMIGRSQSEVARLTRLVARAYGQLESVIFYRDGAGAAAPVLDGVAAELRTIRETVPAAVEAGVPANND